MFLFLLFFCFVFASQRGKEIVSGVMSANFSFKTTLQGSDVFVTVESHDSSCSNWVNENLRNLTEC